jgi:hypothetical protein
VNRPDDSGLIYRRSFEAADLLDRFPPRLHGPKKRAILRRASPPGWCLNSNGLRSTVPHRPCSRIYLED